VLHLAGLDELLDRAGDLLDRCLRVDPMLVEQVDRLGAEPPQRPVDRPSDRLRPARQAGLLALLVERESELRGDDDVLPEGRERLADELLVDERS
jgi:hypothetical protein